MPVLPVIPRRIDWRNFLGWVSGPVAFLLSSGLIIWLVRSV